MTTTLAVLVKELTLFRKNPSITVFMFVVPVLLTALLSHPFASLSGGRGADHTVPGFTLMFGFYVVLFMSLAHYREHGWGTWTLVRVSGVSRTRLAFDMVLPYFLLSVAQMLIMVAAGRLLFGARLNGSVVGLVLLVMATAASSVAVALLVLMLTSSVTAAQNISNLLVLVLGTFAGALVPMRAMPGWTQPLARATPHYWALEGLKGVLSGGHGLGDVLPNLAVLTVLAGSIFVLAVARFDPAKSRRHPML